MKRAILFDDGSGDTTGGGGTVVTDPPTAPLKWYEGAEEDTKALILNKGWKGPDDAIKSYRELEKMMGSNTVAIPKDDAPTEEWNTFYNKLGRPENVDGYKTPEFKFDDENLKVDEEVLKPFKELFHEIGVLPKQAEKILGRYFEAENARMKEQAEATELAKANAEAELKKILGDKYDSRVDIARNALNHISDPELTEFLDSTGLGNDPRMVKMFIKIGQSLMEDSAHGQGDGFKVNDSTQARMEIETLKTDKAFMEKYLKGDKGAMMKWDQLHQIAFPKQKAT